MKQADKIRKYATKHYIEPARRKGTAEIRIVARDVLRGLKYPTSRAPAVCSALKTKKFLSQNHLTLSRADGPPKMQSVKVTYTYRLRESTGKSQRELNREAFLKLRGIAKDVFESLGGGEEFLRKEREQFYAPGHENQK